nr:peritrophin-1 isoform X2 [Drosophila bipectinata]
MKGLSLIALFGLAALIVSPIVLANNADPSTPEPPQVDPIESTEQPISAESTPEDSTPAIETTTEEPTTEDSTTEEPTTEDSTTEEPTTTEIPPVLCDETEIFRPASDCREYYQCFNGEGVLKRCPDNLYWDPKLNVCGWDTQYCTSGEISTTTSAPGGLSCASGAAYLPYLPDCNKYIQCVYNIGFKQSCPPGLYWNQPLQRCDYTCDNSI